MNLALLRGLELDEVSIPRGEVLLIQGERGAKVYVLLLGGVEITVENHLLAKEVSPGTILGEISALLGTNNAATVRATEDSTFYVIEDFVQFLTENPTVAINVSQTLAYRLVYMNEHFVEIRNQIFGISEKLASYLPVFNSDSKDEG